MRHLTIALPIIVAALSPTAAVAKQTYLSCVYQETGGYGERLEVTADDGNGTVSIYVPRTKISVRYNAAFSPQAVAFTDPIGISYVIDRSDLSLTVTRLGGNPQPGRCSIATPAKRAFLATYLPAPPTSY